MGVKSKSQKFAKPIHYQKMSVIYSLKIVILQGEFEIIEAERFITDTLELLTNCLKVL